MNTRTKRPSPKYTLEFKQNAARLINEKGCAHQQVVDHLGVFLSAIGRWSRVERSPAASSSGKAVVLSLTEQTELIRLRRENDQLRMEREIIKRRQVSKPRKSNKVRVYSRATEDVPGYRAMSCDRG